MVNDIDEIYVQITADIRNLEAGLSQANKRIGEFGKKTDDSNKQTISSFNDLGKSAKLVAAAIRVAYTVVAASAITNFVKDAVNAFDKYEGSIKALNNISGDQADAIVKNMDVMAQGLVSSSQLVKDANKALMAEFTPTQAVELMKTASASAAIMSNDISNTYGQLIDSIIQGRDKVLKTQLGITVDFQKAFSEYENSVGLAAGSLDDATKQQIAFNLIMAETPGLVEKAKGVVDEYDKSVARTARSWEDAKKTIGEAFQPAMTNVLDTLSRAMITMQNLDLAFESWVYSIRNFIEDKTGWFSITGQKELLDITPEQKKRSADIALKLGEITPAEYEKMYPAEKINDDLVEQLRLNEKISDVTTQIKTREVQIYREGLEPQAKKIYDINTFYDYQITQLLALGATQEQIKSVEDARTAELKAQNSELDKQIQKMIKLTSFSMSGGSGISPTSGCSISSWTAFTCRSGRGLTSRKRCWAPTQSWSREKRSFCI